MTGGALSVSVRGLRKAFGGQTALDGVSLELEAGLMHGIIGPEGAGKTTLMRVLLGLMKPQAGEVVFFLNGKASPFAELRDAVAYMPQTQSLYPDLSIDEHLEFFRDLYGIPAQSYAEKREELLRITRLKEFTDRPAGKLSGGMYKKLGLMCALLRSPRAMVLDEPTNGVDPISRREFWELLYRLLGREILIVVTTSYMDEAERCSRVHLLDRGRLVAAGEPRALLEQEGVSGFDELFRRRSALREAA